MKLWVDCRSKQNMGELGTGSKGYEMSAYDRIWPLMAHWRGGDAAAKMPPKCTERGDGWDGWGEWECYWIHN